MAKRWGLTKRPLLVRIFGILRSIVLHILFFYIFYFCVFFIACVHSFTFDFILGYLLFSILVLLFTVLLLILLFKWSCLCGAKVKVHPSGLSLNNQLEEKLFKWILFVDEMFELGVVNPIRTNLLKSAIIFL